MSFLVAAQHALTVNVGTPSKVVAYGSRDWAAYQKAAGPRNQVQEESMQTARFSLCSFPRQSELTDFLRWQKRPVFVLANLVATSYL